MSKTAQAQEVFSVVMDRSASADRRREALDQLAAIKRAAKVSYTKLGINEEYLNEAISMLDGGAIEDTTEEQTEQETAQEDEQTEEGTQSERAMKRAKIVALLQETAEEPRREQVRRLVEDLGLTMYAAYYYARAYQPK